MNKEDVIKDSGYELFLKLVSEKKKLVSEKLILDKKDNHKYPIESVPFNIPRNWYWCYLSDISLIQEGPGIRKHQYQDEGIQFLTVTNILEDAIDLEKSKKYISLSEYEKTYKHFTINKGDIVTACSGGSWGKSAMFELDDKLILNTSTLRLRFYNDLGDNRYLYYLTKTSYFKDSLSSYVTGQQPNYGYSHYSKIPIPLPPLPEQQRIVAILDEAFAAIAKAKANAEQNLQNAKQLFESYLQSVFENKGDGWEEKKLGEVCDIKHGYAFEGDDFETDFSGSNPIVLTPGNFKEDCKLSFTNKNTKRCKTEYPKDYLFSVGELVVVMTDLSSLMKILGKPAIIDRDDILHNQRIGRFVFKEDSIEKSYLFYFLQTNKYLNKVKESATGTMVRHTAPKRILNIEIQFPKSLKEQQTIVRQLDALRAETQKLEAVYQKKIDDLEELKKSILQKAFNGEL
jgi:type I restriction enzyme S subunit